MIRRAWLASSLAWCVVLALGAGASAQDANKDKDQGGRGDQKSTEARTVRGVIAGVTVEGELAVDYRTRRAVEADMTLLTVVGSQRHGQGNTGQADQHQPGHHHHNLYVLVLSPRTQVRDAREGNDENGKPSSLDAVEIGDRVEVKFTPREEDQSGTNADQARKQKHGRHRTYFGDAISITMLPQAHHDGQNSGDKKDDSGDKDKDKDQK